MPFPPSTSRQLLQLHSLLLKIPLPHHHHHPLISHLISSLFSLSIHQNHTSIFAWNSLIRGYTDISRHSDAIQLFVDLRCAGVYTDNYTYPFVLKACRNKSVEEQGRMVHGEIVKCGGLSDSYVGNNLLIMYSCWGRIECARRVFDEMTVRDVVSWSSVIEAFVSSDHPYDAVLLFRQMSLARIKPNSVTLVSLLSACNELSKLSIGRAVHTRIIINTDLDVAIGTALVRMYAKYGCIDDALNVFNSMQSKNLQSWTTMIAGLADNCRGRDAISLFIQMEDSGIRPDSVIFSCILSCCSHLGMTSEGKYYFGRMVEEYNITPRIEHYGCMVDMFARAGLVEAAYDFIMKMPIAPNGVILRSFVAGCRKSGLVAENRVMKLLVQEEPELGANYVLAANVSSLSGRWDEAGRILSDILKRRLEKVPGCSWLAVNRTNISSCSTER